MPSPRHHVVDIDCSDSVGEASTPPAADSTLADNLRDRLTIAGRERDQHAQDSVVENNADPTRGGDPPTSSISFIGSSANVESPTTDLTLADDLRDRLAIAGRERDQRAQDSVIVNNADPTRDGDPPSSSISFIGLPGARTSDTIRPHSTIGESHSRRVGFPGEILERCSWCKKRLPENTDLYMYGYDLGVFCSVECRKKQMALDGYQVEDNVRQCNFHPR